MLALSTTYIQKHLYNASWEETLSETDATEVLCKLVSLITIRVLDKTHQFNTFIKKGLHIFKTVSHSTEDKNRLNLLKKLHKESSLSHTTKIIQAKIKEYNQTTHDSSQTTKEYPTLFSAQIQSKRSINRLKSIAEIWLKKALIKTSVIKALPQWNEKDKKELAYDSLRIILATVAAFPKTLLPKNQSIYVAFDKNRKVHAIALVSLKEKTDQKIEYLITNPDDLDILGTEKGMVRGAGSSLIRHISKNALSSKKINTISLAPTYSAIPFYEKLGFKPEQNKMTLQNEGLKSLSENTPSTHIPLQKEPSSYLVG